MYLAIGLVLVPLCQRLHRLREVCTKVPAKPSGASSVGAIGAVLQELWGLFVDDVWLAAGVVALVGVVWLTQANSAVSAAALCLFFAGGLNAVLTLSAARRAKE